MGDKSSTIIPPGINSKLEHKYNMIDVKNLFDDSICYILNSKDYQQIYKHLNIKLVLGYIAISVAFYGSLYNYFHTFEESKKILIFSVIIFFIFNSLFTLYIHYIENNVIYEGFLKADQSKVWYSFLLF